MASDASSTLLPVVEVVQVWSQAFPTVRPLYYGITPASRGEEVKRAYKAHLRANLGVFFFQIIRVSAKLAH